MTNNTQSRADAMVQRVKLHYDGMQKAAANTERVPESRGGRDSKGRYATGTSGNPGGKYKGIVDYVKSRTNNYQDLIDLLLDGAAGKSIDGHTPTFQQRVDCANDLLNRTIGKPIQQIQHQEYDGVKALMAGRLKLRTLEVELSLEKTRLAAGGHVLEHEPNPQALAPISLSAMNVMRQRQAHP